MRTVKLALFLLGLGIFANSETCLAEDSFFEGPPVQLLEGEQRILKVPDLARFSIGGSRVRAARVPGRVPRKNPPLLLKALSLGQTDLWLWKTDGSAEHRSIEVLRSPKNLPIPQSLALALGKLEEVEVLPTESQFLIRGEVTSLGEASRIQALRKTFPARVLDETEFSPGLADSLESRVRAWIEARGSRLRLERSGSSLRVSGAIPNALERSSIERTVSRLFPGVWVQLEALPDSSPTVYFRVFLLEMKKARMGSLGIAWPAQQLSAFRLNSWGLKEALQLDLALQAMEGQGMARVLSNPELAVRAPGDAELFSGGELPIRTQTHYSSQVAWKSFGLLLKLHVSHVAGDQVRVEILTEASHLNTDVGSDGIPGLQSNRMKTQVDATFGVPLLLSGLLTQGTREQARGLPWLSRIPVLGRLFGSEDYQRERSELVAILLPLAKPPSAPMGRVQAVKRPAETRALPVSYKKRGLIRAPARSTYPWRS